MHKNAQDKTAFWYSQYLDLKIQSCISVVLLTIILIADRFFKTTTRKILFYVQHASIKVLIGIFLFSLISGLANQLIKRFNIKNNKYINILTAFSLVVNIIFVFMPLVNKNMIIALLGLYTSWFLLNLISLLQLISRYMQPVDNNYFAKSSKFFKESWHEITKVDFDKADRLLVSILMVVAFAIIFMYVIQTIVSLIKPIIQFVITR